MDNFQITPGPIMPFGEAVKRCFKKYADFNGRASRAEYWWFMLFNCIISVIFSGLGQAANFFNILGGLYSLAVLVPSLAVAWRRMHDIGKGGGWFFISFVPLIGWIWFIVLAATRGEAGANRFGDAPEC